MATESSSDFDAEKQFDLLKQEKINLNGGDQTTPREGKLQRKLQARHIAMISIGGTIGTGLFVGSGEALAKGGPVGLLLGYLIMGLIVYSMMVALGEMSAMYPLSGSFAYYATRWLDPALGFALGYNYWFCWAMSLPTEITAAAIVIGYWDSTTTPAAWITIFIVVTLLINFAGVRYYGEAEFWFSFIKVTTIVGLIILGIVLDLGGGPNHDRIGFRYWKNPGAFNQYNGIEGPKGRFLAFWATLVTAAFSYNGTEIVALAASEAEDPRRTVPKAIRRVFYRIVLFYVGGVVVIGWLVPYNNKQLLSGSSNASASPFVIAIENAGIKVLPSIINAVILISAFSAGNSDLYASSRMLYGLATSKQAPEFFRKVTKSGLPVNAVAVSSLFAFLSYLNVASGPSRVFNWFANIISITGMISWSLILITYLRFRAGTTYHGVDRSKFPYRAPFQPYLSYFGIVMILLIIIFNGFAVFLNGNWDTASFIDSYIILPIFAILWAGWRFVRKSRIVPLEEMDFVTGLRELDEEDEKLAAARSQGPRPWYVRVWNWISKWTI